jgi:hypothetical protein
MKPLREVEKTRLDSYMDAQKNSVHRSSLLVPVIPQAEVSISFLNHFLIKRNNPNVGLRITAIGEKGERLLTRFFPINEARVYIFHLQRDFCSTATSYLVEFFSSSNLVIPFPAVMVNHRGPNSYSTVHSFNRVLNDIFEDDEINAIQVEEGGIDIAQSSDSSTFFTVFAGQQELRGEVGLRFKNDSGVLTKQLPVTLPRLTHQTFFLRDVFPEAEHQQGVLLIQQPHQSMFYGRLLVGQASSTGDFSANHSYYDNSTVEGEYWDDTKPSHRTYPLVPGLSTKLRIFPIQSPSQLEFSIAIKDVSGAVLGTSSGFRLTSPSTNLLEIDISQISSSLNIDFTKTSAVTLTARPIDGNTPMRISHQLVFGSSGLESSVIVAMHSHHILHSSERSRTTWGQLIHSPDFNSWLSIANDGTTDSEVVVSLFSKAGLIASIPLSVTQGACSQFLLTDVLDSSLDFEEFIWYEFESFNYFLTAWTISQHKTSGHCSGEHSF